MFRQSIYTLVIISLILSSITPATVSARAIQPTIQPSNDPTNELSIYLAPPDSQPLLRAIPTDLPTLYQNAVEFQQSVGPYRTTVTIRGTADLARLKKIGVTILASNLPTSPLQGGTRGGSATVIADRLQLEQLAKLQFAPRQTELTARLQTTTRAPLAAAATAAQVLAATATDSDNDGLNDTEEGWWCTDPNNPDSNNDGIKDGDHVQALRD